MKKNLFALFSIFILLAFPLKAEDMDVPTIVGPDDREEITGSANGPEQAVVVIEAIESSTIFSEMVDLCSGTMVGPNLVLTAAHCLIDDEGQFIEKINVYAVGLPASEMFDGSDKNANQEWTFHVNSQNSQNPQNASRETSFRESLRDLRKDTEDVLRTAMKQTERLAHMRGGITNWSLHAYPYARAKQSWVPHKFLHAVFDKDNDLAILERHENDYALLVLNYDLGKMTGWLKVKALSDEELTDANILSIGRGGDKPDRTLWMSPGHVGSVSEYYISHDADTLSGNSGGPIFKKGDAKNIIALDNWGLKGATHTESGYPNQGLRIRKDIETLVKHIDNSAYRDKFQGYLLYAQSL